MEKYGLYIDYDCVEEFDTLEEAKTAFDKAVSDNPNSVIDVLSDDGEISYYGYGE